MDFIQFGEFSAEELAKILQNDFALTDEGEESKFKADSTGTSYSTEVELAMANVNEGSAQETAKVRERLNGDSSEDEEEFTEEELADLRGAFSLFDKSGYESITILELNTFKRLMGQDSTRTELQHMLDEGEPPDRFKFDSQEFISRKLKAAEEKINAAFLLFDRDQQGEIFTFKLGQVMKKLCEKLTGEEVDSLIKQADLNADGKINFKEFGMLMMGVKDGVML